MTLVLSKKIICFWNLKLGTHRSWADFSIHDMMCGYNCSFLSRLGVAIVFPLGWIMSFISSTVFFF